MSNVELDEEENKGLLKSEDQSVKSSNNNEENNKKDSNDKKLPPKQPEIEYEEEEEDLEEHADTVMTILKPVSLTMLLVIWGVKSIEEETSSTSAAISQVVIDTSGSSSTGTQVLTAIGIAIGFLLGILGVTVLFVILYKYRCMKIIFGWLITSSLVMLAVFGGGFGYYVLQHYNIPMDYLTMGILLWNFAVVGIIAVFWHGHVRINQGYLIFISGLLAIFFTRLPEWATLAILAIVAVYDLFAVLCPKGPLKVLVETAQERNEQIPALLYNASVYMTMADVDEPPRRPSNNTNTSNSVNNTDSRQPEEQEPGRRGIKLGLGDFVFYSVLIGRAAMFDMITVFTCFMGIITGLFFTLILLAIFRKALPALPISIFFGLVFYFATRYVLLPYVIVLGEQGVFV